MIKNMPARTDNEKLVYSTDAGRICDKCSKPIGQCSCVEEKRQAVKGSGSIRVRRETKGRGGKTVTSISGLPLNEMQLKLLASDLKRLCGSGGTVKEGVIEVQGEHCDVVLEELAKRGYQGKRAGG